MFKKLKWDLSNKGKFWPISDNLTGPILEHYYLLFTDDLAKLNELIVGFDESGIPLNRSYIDVDDEGFHYYPISIGQVALSIFNNYNRTGNPSKIEHFLKVADWFVENAEHTHAIGTYWTTNVPKPEYQIEGVWKSAFAQSRALSVLMRAWQHTGENRYLEVSAQALKPFGIDIADGGVAIRRKDADIFYEEYVASVPTRVLDGHCFALFGLYDFYRATQKEEGSLSRKMAKQFFDEGVKGLEESLPKYDLGYWVRFNRCELPGYPTYDPCTLTYLQLVITQLEVLYRITGSKILLDYKNKFSTYIKWKNIIRMYFAKLSSLRKLNRL